MEKNFLKFIKDPEDTSDLQFYSFEEEGENIINGLLVNPTKYNAYPILDGVPVMLPSMFSSSFIDKFKNELDNVNKEHSNNLSFKQTKFNWSFSDEWQYHFDNSMDETWGWTIKERFEQFLLETESQSNELNNKLILDAGCGNGDLTKYISNYSEITFGIDLSTSVFLAEKNRKSKNACFIMGDLQAMPFKDKTFDIMVSNGVIHHTPNTETTFYSLARKVALKGKLYIWLYSEKGNFVWRVKRKLFDIARMIVCRLNSKMQSWIVSAFVAILKIINPNTDKKKLRISMYDAITPRWRHYHTPEEVAYWYYRSEFGAISLTHFDNKYGFGIYAKKIPMDKTPGLNYGKEEIKSVLM